MSDEFQDRIRKREELEKLQIHPHPSRFERTHSIDQALTLGEQKLRTFEDITEKGVKARITLAGRIMTFREHGKLSFANLKDPSGTLQIAFTENLLGKDTYKLLRKLDIADFLGVSGELFMTKHGQLTLLADQFTLLGKTLRPLPEKWHGISDQETIYRSRYLDLLMNEASTQRFKLRSRFTQLVRDHLNQHEFLEVETPILASKASGATAKPFSTHHNALDLDVYLRIAPETYLKRCVVGGLERVYEFAKCFRNEGMDPSHLQEFTMLEYYAAYWNYEDNMRFTEAMLSKVIQELFGSLKIRILSREGGSTEVDFTPPWPRHEFAQLIEDACGIDIFAHNEDAEALRTAIKKAKVQIDDIAKLGFGNLCDALYKKVARPNLIQPCFVIHHPASTKPLARRKDDAPHLCETFQMLVNTWEVVNAYSELVDPLDQRQRFIDQMTAQMHGDDEAMQTDEDYLRAMEHGMPPISGWGMGIDRIVALLTEQSNLKDVVLFPLLRPLESDLKAESKMREKAKKAMKKG